MNSYNHNKETTVQLFKKYIFSPFQNRPPTENEDQLEHIALEIYNWARNMGAQYVSPFVHHMRSSIIQRQDTFLSLNFIKENLIQSIGLQKLSFKDIWNVQIDGSSISNGGLRQPAQGRTYLLWDHLSELFIRKKHGILYIPSLIINPKGNGIDDKVYFRKTEQMLQKYVGKLLNKLNIQFQAVFFGLNVQQQFFIFPKQFTDKRLDFRYSKRAIVGNKPIYSPPTLFYVKKIPDQVLKTLKQAENQLLQLGVPIKTRHCEGSPNQFELCTEVQKASAALDHNVLKMLILQEACERNGLQANFHEKPYSNVNGSGKHINFSISYLNKDKKLKNLFDLNSQHREALILFILITLKAAQDNRKLMIASTMTAGNQVRFGQKQAPLPIMSVYLGEQASNLIEELPKPQAKNLKQKIDILLKKQYPDIGDRNRTSSLAYSQNRFQFRLAGSSQNVTFPTTVIFASLLNEIKNVLIRLQNGQTISEIINQYREETKRVRFQGDNYTQEWKKQAQKRQIYDPNKTISDYLKDLKTNAKVLVDNQIYTNEEIQAKYQMMKIDYFDTVKIQKDCLLKIVNKNIIPRGYSFISSFPRELHLKNIENRMKKFDKLFEELIAKIEELQNAEIDDSNQKSAYEVRQQMNKVAEVVDKILDYLPQSESFPNIYNYLDKWQAV